MNSTKEWKYGIRNVFHQAHLLVFDGFEIPMYINEDGKQVLGYQEGEMIYYRNEDGSLSSADHSLTLKH